ncbi:MAG: CBS domain-containing protein [Candidatus Firestonebacteria bacterium]|nr:CBS domain-containing protein [Candidatus Firestonebacteria bacterium]
MEIITSHSNIDFDGFACILAAKKLYPEAKCILPNTIEQNVSEFLKMHPEVKEYFSELNPEDYKKVTLLVLVDTQQTERIGIISGIMNNQAIKLHIYDHHPKLPGRINPDFELCKDTGATVTLLIQKIKENKIEITKEEATIFALGIYEDTGSLSYISTTPEDIDAAAYLLRMGAQLKEIPRYINRDLNPQQINLLNELLISSEEYKINNIKVIIAQASTNKYIGDLAILAHRLRDIGDIDVLFCIVKMGDKIYFVARSRKEEIDVGEIAREFGGGGHPQAASSVIKDLTKEETIEKLVNILARKEKHEIKASFIMSTHVISLKEDTNIDEAKKMMLRFNHTGFPILKDDKVVGIITRQDVEKAFLHGLGNTFIRGYMTRDVITANPDTPLALIHSLMINNNIGRIPIVNNSKKILGIVTRTDVLKVLQSVKENKSTLYYNQKSINENKNLASYLESRIPDKIFKLLLNAGQIADKNSYSAYVVGGFVRDILIGNKNLDVDIVIEGNGIDFAEKFAAEYDGTVKSYAKFGTAVVVLPDGFKIDIATARTEFYEYPTALPLVKSSSIKYDLYRRDFTINSLAVKLNPNEFGQLVDFFGGTKDIKKGIIRVLYNLSFIDDPTRIFRAIRFEQRLHFKIDKQTEHFIENAIKLGVFDKIANQRVRDELIIILSEERPVNAIRRMAELNVLALIHPKLKFTSRIENHFYNLYKVFNWFRLLFLKMGIEYWIVYLAVLLNELEEEDTKKVLEKFKFTRKHMNIVNITLKNTNNIISKLESIDKINPSQIYQILYPLSMESILFIMAITNNNVKKKISLFLTHYLEEKTYISGDDLIAMGIKPGEKFKNILKEVLYARLDGKIKTKEDEVEFIKTKGVL